MVFHLGSSGGLSRGDQVAHQARGLLKQQLSPLPDAFVALNAIITLR